MVRMHRLVISILGVIGLTFCSVPARAVPYASAVRLTTGNTYEFVLNEAADSVTVKRDGANPVSFVAPAAGRYTFDMTGFSTFGIQVSKNAPTAWTDISSPSNLFTSFRRPGGLAVSTDPASPYFGTIYVGNSVALPTVAGRTTGDGIYALTADMIGVDLVTKLAVADPNDATQAKAPGFLVVAGAKNGNNSPYRFNLDASGNLIVGDWSDQNGGLKYAAPDLATGGKILAIEDGSVPLLLDPGTSTHEIHGSIVSRPYFTGTVGNNLTVYAIDEDYDSTDGNTLTSPNVGNNLLKWTPGNATDYEGAPTVMMAGNNTTMTITTPYTDQFYSITNGGVQADARYNPQFDKWYITQSRTNGTESSMQILSADGTDADIANPTAPTVLWSSKKFSFDHSLDGFTDDPAVGQEASIGLQDIFREAQTIAFSPDGTKMYLERTAVYTTNPILGTVKAPGAILVIPLDANGLPDLVINDNGTPGDFSDDSISNITTITAAVQGTRQQYAEIYLDAAGNLYTSRASTAGTPTAANSAQRLQVFSPGGNWLATTSGSTSVPNGAFTVTPIVGLLGDYNNDGKVDAADYVVWRDTNINGAQGYTDWRTNFGNPPASAGGASLAAVPEPGSLLLLLIGIAAVGATRRR